MKAIKERLIQVSTRDGDTIYGDLNLPLQPRALIIFAHGSGSSRHSSRNRLVASYLNSIGFATLLIDLLTPREEGVDISTREFRFNIPLLASRLVSTVNWIQSSDLDRLSIGMFGASTGSAAAIMAAVTKSRFVRAVVSRGGRPDLAKNQLGILKAPTLLIVGSKDSQVVELNKQAFDQMRCERQLKLVSGATHLFEEVGALRAVSEMAGEWFEQYLAPPTVRDVAG